MTVLRTSFSNKNWLLNSTNMKLSENGLFGYDYENTVTFEPQLPYFYIPKQDYTYYGSQIQKVYKDVEINFVDEKAAYFNGSCADIKHQDDPL